MNLYCVFGGAKLSRNLLVELAADDHVDDFALSLRQRFETLTQHCKFRLLLAYGPILLQCDSNRIQQILIAERLGEKLDRSRLHSLDRHWNVAVAGNKDDRDGNVGLSQLALKIEPADSPQPDIEDQTAGRVRTLRPQKLRKTETATRRGENRVIAGNLIAAMPL